MTLIWGHAFPLDLKTCLSLSPTLLCCHGLLTPRHLSSSNKSPSLPRSSCWLLHPSPLRTTALAIYVAHFLTLPRCLPSREIPFDSLFMWFSLQQNRDLVEGRGEACNSLYFLPLQNPLLLLAHCSQVSSESHGWMQELARDLEYLVVAMNLAQSIVIFHPLWSNIHKIRPHSCSWVSADIEAQIKAVLA